MGGFVRQDWPDGRSTLEQPAIAVTLLGMVMEKVREASERG